MNEDFENKKGWLFMEHPLKLEFSRKEKDSLGT